MRFLRYAAIFSLLTTTHAATLTVSMTGFQFVPKNLSVNVGDTVTWTNIDNAAHDTTSGTNRVPSGVWRSPLFSRGGSFSFTFTNAGFFANYCTPHVQTFNMVGAITVIIPNLPPTVTLTNPASGTNFMPGENILLEANATDDQAIARVEFFANGIFISTDADAPYTATLTNIAAGFYALTAVAFDQPGISTTSAVVNVSALASPTANITQPANFARFKIGTNIFITADVSAPGLAVNAVQFFERMGNNVSAISPPLKNAPFNFLWQPNLIGTHTLFALTTDERGGTTVSPDVTVEVFEPGARNPTIAITNAPRNFSRVTSTLVVINGTASDDVRLERVEFQLNGGAFLPATGTNRWRAEIGLAAGTNVLNFRAVDFAGNFSTNTTRTLIYAATFPLVVEIRGVGIASPNLNGRKLEIGKFYQMTARPGAGQIFGGWEGAAISNKAILNFQMRSNLVLTANFIPNPFPAVKGTYIVEFSERENPRPETSGMVRVQVANLGNFSGRLTIHRRVFGFTGQFDYLGRAKIPVLRRPIKPVVLDLQLELRDARRLMGTISDGEFISELNAPPETK